LPAAGTGATAGPSFYLNNNSAFSAQNTNYGGPTYVLPTPTGPTAAAQSANVGFYVNSAGGFVTAGAAPGYPDPYLSDRAPEFNFWNFGVQRELTKDITVTSSYAGSQSHFIAGAATMRGLQSGGINPKYFALGAGNLWSGFALKGGYCGKHRVGAGHYAWMLHFAVSRICLGSRHHGWRSDNNHCSGFEVDAAVLKHRRHLGQHRECKL